MAPEESEESAVRRFELMPERTPTDDEALWIEARVGALPASSTLVIRDEEGEMIGAIAPYGKTVRQAGGSHLVSLPASMQSERIVLLVELALPHHRARRPTAEELAELRLVYLPVD